MSAAASELSRASAGLSETCVAVAVAAPSDGGAAPSLAQQPQHEIERRARDQLHGIIGNAVVVAESVDRNNIGVMQTCRGLGLPAKPLNRLEGDPQSAAHDLERNFAVE